MRILAWCGFVALMASTGSMVSAYAYTVGLSHSAAWAWVAAGSAAGLLLTEAALAAGGGLSSPWLRVPALVLAMLAVGSLEIGFASSVFSDARAARADRLRHNARVTVDTAPAAVLQVRLERLEATHPGVTGAWCRSKRAAVRDACQEWLGAREALAVAADVERYRATAPTGDADARAALLARYLGGSEARWADTLILLLVAAMGFARVAAASTLLGAPGGRAEPAVEPVAEPAVEPVAEPAVEPVAEPAVEPVAEPVPGRRLPPSARRVLRAVVAQAAPAPAGSGCIAVVPPGTLSQRRLAESAGVSRRTASTSLQQLSDAGFMRVRTGRTGTEFALLRTA